MRRAEDCPACGHEWREHPGSPGIDDDVCSECAYEVEHEDPDATEQPCRLRTPT